MFPSKKIIKIGKIIFAHNATVFRILTKQKFLQIILTGHIENVTLGKLKKYQIKTIFPPIDLPWSTITFLRWEHISSILSKYCPIENFHNKTLLDYEWI